jgi:outer membrane protein TolC
MVWVGCVALAVAVRADDAQPAAPPPTLSLEGAVDWALRYNPEIAAIRQQHGIAAADIVIARTYPFNPVAENRVQQASGPFSATITNNVPFEQITVLEMELHHQRSIRQQRAAAGLTRTDWEIATQELALSVRTIRAFRGVLYQHEKLRILEESVRFNQDLVGRVRALMDAGRLRGVDLIVAQTELDDARAAVGPGRTALVTAQYDLRRALGVVEEQVRIDGTLEAPLAIWDLGILTAAGLDLRADLRARQAALAEAQARLRLECANRHGNPSMGTAFTYDPTRISAGGVQLNFPLPVFNVHEGEIDQRRAEANRAALELRETEVLVRQDVQNAVARLAAAQARVELYRRQILPDLQRALEGVRRLFLAGEVGVDVLRVIDVQRKLIRGRDGYVDALFELGQAQADLAAAVGQPALILNPAVAVLPDAVPPNR